MLGASSKGEGKVGSKESKAMHGKKSFIKP